MERDTEKNSLLATISDINDYISKQYKDGGLNQVLKLKTFEQIFTILRTNTLLLVITLSLIGGGLVKGIFEAGYSLGKALSYMMN